MSALGMPPHMLALFEARPPLEHLPFRDTSLRRKPGGMAQYVKEFSDEVPVPNPHFETPKERRERKKREKIEAHLANQRELIEQYDPKSGNSLTHDPYKTLFIGNLAYEATERQLRNEFEVYGKIKRVRIIADANGNPRGYAFIEFDTEREMVNAYKRGDGRKIAGRRVIVDVERARTVAGWLPRRLGGGRGTARCAKKNPPLSAQASDSSSYNAKSYSQSRGHSHSRGYSHSQSGRGYTQVTNHYGYNSSRSGYVRSSGSIHGDRRDYSDSKPESRSSRYDESNEVDKQGSRRARSEERDEGRINKSYSHGRDSEREYKRHHA